MNAPDHFELEYQKTKIKVHRHDLSGQVLYRVEFSDRRKPLVLHRAQGSDVGVFWTSIPEGRQKEAQEIGTLIENYLKQSK
jgi:hypothetical protein